MSSTDERLPCGTELGVLIDQVAEARPPADPEHQQTCPYCQAALARIELKWRDLRLLSSQPVAVPDALTFQIMARVRALSAQAADSIVLGQGRGTTRINHVVIARGIQHIVSKVPGVAFASVSLIAKDPPHHRRVDVAVRLVIAFGPAVKTIAAAVRTRLDRQVARRFGAELGRIDITVADVATPRR